MTSRNYRIILASRSPRRRELLAQLIPAERIEVLPPSSADELTFEGLHSQSSIEGRLRSIARTKCTDVVQQLGPDRDQSCVIAADTIIVVTTGEGKSHALGQPPIENWQKTTRRWFLDYYAGRSHEVLTALCVATPVGLNERVVTTRLAFRTDIEKHLEWYLSTKEPIGKAGGYAIQGAGSIFAERIEGSLTNVIGLPLAELRDVLTELDVLPSTTSLTVPRSM